MKILFDQGTPVPLEVPLSTHQVETAAERGWSDLSNGDLLNQAESEGFEALVTTDQNLQYEQNLSGRSIAILVLTRASWPKIQGKISEVRAAVDGLESGDYVEVEI
jgi:predicted nuclease of predicted toxin-antitoxin system